MSEIKLPGGLHRRLDKISAYSTPRNHDHTTDISATDNVKDNNVVLCGICASNRSAYTCPRCNVKYCSRLCYQAESHSSCAETFYRDCCLESLGEVGGADDRQDRAKVANFLKADLQAREEEEGEEEEAETTTTTATDLSDRIFDLDLDSEADLDRLWDRLTPAEKADFEARLASGDAAQWVLAGGGGGGGALSSSSEGLSIPWWEAPLIEEAEVTGSESPSKSDSRRRPPPPIFSKIMPLSSLTKSKPSPTVPNNLVNILFAYAYCWRLYDGAHGESAEAAAEFLRDLLAVSNVLNEEKNENYSSVAAAIAAAVMRLGSSDGGDRALFCSNDFTAVAMEDVAALCSKGKEAAARALSDARAAAKRTPTGAAGERTISVEPEAEETAKRKRKTTTGIVKKLEFYMGWAAEYGEERLGGLSAAVGREASAYRKKIHSVQMQTKVRETSETD